MSEVIKNSMHSMYPTAGDPTHLAFVAWDRGGGGWIDPALPDLSWENFNALEIPT